MRHGIAAPADAGVAADRDRPLTRKGRDRIYKESQGLLALKISPEHIFTSPLLRAQQTAQVVAEVLKTGEPLEEIGELAPEGSPQELIRRLASYRKAQRILLVGHQPLLGETAAFLLSKSDELEIRFKKGGLCCIEVDRLPPEKAAVLHWMLTPKQLRLLAGP